MVEVERVFSKYILRLVEVVIVPFVNSKLKPCPLALPTLQILRPFSLFIIPRSPHKWLYLRHPSAMAVLQTKPQAWGPRLCSPRSSRRPSECCTYTCCDDNADGRISNPAFISPTDNLLTPCTQKLSAARKKHFNKYEILIAFTSVC